MPAKSESQRKMIFAKRDQYKTKENTPKKYKFIWDKDWENKGPLPNKVKKEQKLKELVKNLVSKILVKEGYIKVPDGYEDKIKSMADLMKMKSDFYNANGVNQLLIDLNYIIHQSLRDYVHGNTGKVNKAGFEKALGRELESVLYKYTTGKFQLFDNPDKKKIKNTIIKIVSKNIDVEKVDLRDKSILKKIKDASTEIINTLLK